ncbi:hypothetical protein C3486_01785 [Streptomyces sp. Ru73]|uniref:hypothetical protein n=1 Tax=Streptomyces sp. Ru73 TaxID=2080748 RepID=UPI000CDDD92A|nr:hypothetical protein [Streptomyces sp. Ru73]POX43299.1 hypothetical protein C3486_01785 [Streptomyces sp. Ru73]
MVRKKVEGDEDQRRAAAHEAERAGEKPSVQGRTTGASKQRTHVPDRSTMTHEEKVAPLHRGKQDWPGDQSGPVRPGTSQEPARSYTGRGRPGYGEEHERVFRAVAEAEGEHGRAAYLDEVARTAGLPPDRTRTLLHDLATTHNLVTQLAGTDSPDQGPRFETRPGH